MRALFRSSLPAVVIALLALLIATAVSGGAAQRSGTTSTTLSFTTLKLQNGWTTSSFGTRAPAVAVDGNGIVHFEGGMETGGTNPVPFTLPKAFRPSATVFVPVDLCNATNGRLQINPNGTTTVQAEGGAFSNASCFTSLDGVAFAR
jgi:hypothetical protein